MPPLTDGIELPPPGLGFVVYAQKVELDIDFAARSVKGKTQITIQPTSRELRSVRLNCRQCTLTRVNVEGKAAEVIYEDLYDRLSLHSSTSLKQHHFLRSRINELKNAETEELVIRLPKSIQIRELDPFSAAAQDFIFNGVSNLPRRDTADAATIVGTPLARTADEHGTVFAPIRINIEYVIDQFRDGLHFVGVNDGDTRYPHLYTRNSIFPGSSSCIFPCVDDGSSRCLWEISVRCPRTLGDVFRKSGGNIARQNGVSGSSKGAQNGSGSQKQAQVIESGGVDLSEEEKAIEMAVICSGDMTDDIHDSKDPSRKTVSFSCTSPVAPRHIGIIIGPFEHVDLSDLRESDQDEKLGSNAIRVHGFCLPGRAAEVRNTCMSCAQAIDYFTMNYGQYPFTSYKLCFVDDLVPDIAHTASLSICSARLLYPEDILEPLDTVTRKLVHALASQWYGVHVTPKESMDWWIIVGGSYFMTDMFLKELCGRNDFKFRQKLMADKVFESDVKRPSLYALGPILHFDQTEMDFMELKAPLVLFILHNRLVKASGRNGVNRCLWRVLVNANVGELHNGEISTAEFQRVCEKVGHMPGKLDPFFLQWVKGAGCPVFSVSVRFNKKKTLVEMLVNQVQRDRAENNTDQHLDSGNFMREVKEHLQNIYAGPVQGVFQGPMTIRIHEADGTPYEHIIDIKEATTKVEIPYFTKYKRLKRSRRQKERAAAAAGVDISGDTQDDVLLYCLGDVLQSEEEVNEWRLTDWSKEDEDRMNQESYEWVRMDADFEWISKITINLPHYMFVSQLQQDKDVSAQVESIQYLAAQRPFPLVSSILIRTLMDSRYFHGIRTMATTALARCAKEELDWIGLFHLEKAFQEFFCLPGSPMTRSNDFSDRSAYIIQNAIPRAIAKIRDNQGKAPMRVKQFFMDKLKFNDNSNNEYSDSYYVAMLTSCLAESLTTTGEAAGFAIDLEDEQQELEFQRNALEEIKRYQRIDEWLPTFHNIYTTTGLGSRLRLMKNGVIDRRPHEFLQYTRPGNADIVRLKAFGCLVELGALKSTPLAQFLFHSMEKDASPFFRSEMHRILGQGLGQIATGELKVEVTPQRVTDGFLVQDTAQDQPSDIARKTSVPAALDALKSELSGEVGVQKGMEQALKSGNTSLSEIEHFLEICALLYNTEDKLLVRLRYPRYWGVKHMGEGKLKFTQTKRIRTTIAPRWVPPTAAPSKLIFRPPPHEKPVKRPSTNKPSVPLPHASTSQPLPTPKITSASSAVQAGHNAVHKATVHNTHSSASGTITVSQKPVARNPSRPSKIVKLKISPSKLARIIKLNTPRSAIAKSSAPKLSAPKLSAPKSSAPKSSAPKSSAPKSSAPKSRNISSITRVDSSPAALSSTKPTHKPSKIAVSSSQNAQSRPNPPPRSMSNSSVGAVTTSQPGETKPLKIKLFNLKPKDSS